LSGPARIFPAAARAWLTSAVKPAHNGALAVVPPTICATPGKMITTPVVGSGSGATSGTNRAGAPISQATLALNALSGVRPMIETMPLARAPDDAR